MKDVMIDLETMGTHFNAPIIEFGGIYFDRYTGEIKKECHIYINLEDEIRNKFYPDGDTIMWWLEQNEDARDNIINGEKLLSMHALGMINNFLKNAKNIWSHATFDYVILMNHLNKLLIKPSFHYRSARDIRTLVNLVDSVEI